MLKSQRYFVKSAKPPTKVSHYALFLKSFDQHLAANGKRIEDYGQPPEAHFEPPEHQPIKIPAEFLTAEQRAVFTVACHEAGHGLMNLLQCNEVTGLFVQWINNCAIGSAMNRHDQPGLEGAFISLAGLAAEQLVAGVGPCIDGSATDIRYAQANLREAGFDEEDLPYEMTGIVQECQRMFRKDWLPGIVAAATQLARTGILSPTQFIDLLATAQQNAQLAGTLHKAMTGLIEQGRFANQHPTNEGKKWN